MLRSIWDDLKREFSYGNAVTRIILVNVGVFVLINLWNIGLFLYRGVESNEDYFYTNVLRYISMSSDWKFILLHPWVLVTHMFSHFYFRHILWNLLFYQMCGRIMGDLLGNKRVLPIYLLGGLVGALFFFIFD